MSSVAEVNRPRLLPILSIHFVGTMGFSIVLPFLIFLVIRLGGNAFIYGVMGATYSTFQLIGAPILGKWSDQFGRRRILLLSQLGTLLAWGLFLLALMMPITPIQKVDHWLTGQFVLTIPLLMLFIARALDGITGGNISVANAYMADVSDEKNRSKNFGLMSVAGNLGFVLGPAIAGLIGQFGDGEFLPVATAFAISGFAAFLVFALLPESKPCTILKRLENEGVSASLGHSHKECYPIQVEEERSFWQIIRVPQLTFLLMINFLVFLGFNFFYITFPVFAVKQLNWALSDTGTFFASLGLMMAVVQGPILGWASQRLSEKTLSITGSLLLALAFWCFNSNEGWMMYVAAAGLALGNGLLWPSVLAMISKSVKPSEQGRVQGISGSLGSLASILGLLIGGMLYEYWGGNVFYLSMGIMSVIFILLIIHRR